MRNAYALLGLSFLIVFGGAYFLLSDKAHAPTPEDNPIQIQAQDNTIETMSLTLTSSAFEQDGLIPSKYTCDGDNTSPPLTIEGIPEGTASLVLVMDDPDIPTEIKNSRGIEKFNHWVVYNLSAETGILEEGEVTGSQGDNSRGEGGYTGPCPPTEYEPTEHRYIFRLYALSGQLNFIKSPTLDEVEAAALGAMLEKAELIGRYSRVTE